MVVKLVSLAIILLNSMILHAYCRQTVGLSTLWHFCAWFV